MPFAEEEVRRGVSQGLRGHRGTLFAACLPDPLPAPRIWSHPVMALIPSVLAAVKRQVGVFVCALLEHRCTFEHTASYHSLSTYREKFNLPSD